MCPLVNELKTRKGLKTVVCVTGQHRQMLDQVLDSFQVTPDYDLAIMKDKQTLFDVTTNILNGIGKVLDEVKPDVVLVHGDTSTTFVTALACFYKQIPVGHVEAGLRTFDRYSPFPEEMNRCMVGRLALTTSIAPTRRSSIDKLLESSPSITLLPPSSRKRIFSGKGKPQNRSLSPATPPSTRYRPRFATPILIPS